MQNVTRRSFVSSVAASVTALGALSGISNEADAQLVWKASDWKLAEFEKLVKDPARIKQVYDVVQINDGKFLNNVKNSLNGGTKSVCSAPSTKPAWLRSNSADGRENEGSTPSSLTLTQLE